MRSLPTTLNAVCLLLLLSAPGMAQTTWLVSNDPAENPDFSSINEAARSPLVQPNDIIEISEGIGPYLTRVMVDIPLVFRAQAGEMPTIIPDASAMLHPFYAFWASFETDPRLEFDGIRFLGTGLASGEEGRAIITQGSGAVRHCVFESLLEGVGGLPQGVTVSNCQFLDARGRQLGGGANWEVDDCDFQTANPTPSMRFLSGVGVIRNCRFSGGPVGSFNFGARFVNCVIEDAVLHPGQALFSATISPCALTLDQCVIANITSPDRSVVHPNASTVTVTIRQCTIADCTAPSFAGVSQGNSLVIRNCVFGSNSFDTLVPVTSPADVAFCILDQPFPGVGNLATGPLFTNAQTGDYTLRRGSPAVDAGDSSVVIPDITSDLLGNSRRADDPIMPDTGVGPPPVIDIGAFELQPPPAGYCQADLTTTAIHGTPGYGMPNGILNNDDFFYYLTTFTDVLGCGNGSGLTRCPSPPDMTTTAIPGTPGYGELDGRVGLDDLFYYLVLFSAGC